MTEKKKPAGKVSEGSPEGEETKQPVVEDRRATAQPRQEEVSVIGVVKLPILAIRNLVTFPLHIQPIEVGRPQSLKALEAAQGERPFIGLIAQRDPRTDEPTFDDLYEFGTVAQILQQQKLDTKGAVRILIHGQQRFRIRKRLQERPYLLAEVELLEATEPSDDEALALRHSVMELFREYIQRHEVLPNELITTASSIPQVGQLCDFIANHAFDLEKRQQVLETVPIKERLRLTLKLLAHEVEILKISQKIQSQVEEEVGKHQREFFLRKKLEEIKKELGETDEREQEQAHYKERIEAAGMPEEVKKKALTELDRLSRMHPDSAEAAVVRTYLDTLCDLPWNRTTEDNQDLDKAWQILEEDHYGLNEVKERLLEYLAVLKLRGEIKGPILCLIGPPGVGKTSLGRSVARALGRKFDRIALGGMHDEAEIRGHRRTYVGAMPGRIIQALRKLGTKNPVILLDEIDKVGRDWRGDPASALLEVLDPEQNWTFTDNYLEVPFDLSKVLFICTGNITDTIHPALKDRLEIIHLPGYTELEKEKIAQRYLIPKQIEAHGLKRSQISFTPAAIRHIILNYTHEAGVRNLEREIAKVCRKVARQIATGKAKRVSVSTKNLEQFLGAPEPRVSLARRKPAPGLATGLAWTATGGDTLLIETLAMEGKGELMLTGQLGEVMKESAEAAMSFVRAHRKKLGIKEKFDFSKLDVHIHFPAGAIPKDGPSAGITITTALVSLFSEVPVRSDVAMSGEMTLTGRVLPIGGLKEKLLAARRDRIFKVIIPEANAKDLTEVPDEIKEGMQIVFVERIEEVLSYALMEPAGEIRLRDWKKIKPYRPPKQRAREARRGKEKRKPKAALPPC